MLKEKLFGFFVLLLIGFSSLLIGAPIITNVSPYFGPVAGGTSVTIQGNGFTGTTAVNFGNTPATSFTVNSDASITAIAPAHSPQVTFITLVNLNDTSPITQEASYVYQGDGFAYVANSTNMSISAINTNTDTVTATVGVGNIPSSIAFTPDGNKAYIANFTDGTISVIDTATNTVIQTISIGASTYSLAVSSDGQKLYATDFIQNSFIVIDVKTDTIISTVSLGSSSPQNFAITSDQNFAYVVSITNFVQVIDVISNTVSATIDVGNSSNAIVILPNGTKAYVSSFNSPNISVIDIASNTVLTNITAQNSPSALILSPDGNNVYVVNGGGSSVSVIDTVTDTVTATIAVGIGARTGVTNSDGSRLYVINFNDNTLSVIDTVFNTVIATINVAPLPTSLFITPDDSKVYVTSNSNIIAADPLISVIDTSTNSVITTINTNSETDYIVVSPDQAPLARFVATSKPAGVPSIFDASSSISPIGTITNYFWDFGDGNTLNTVSTIINYTYSSPGIYPVTLVVTNSSGTSTQQVLISPSYLQQSTPIVTKQGGPSAVTSQTLVISNFVLPNITSLNPNSGPELGGTSVVIIGTGFTGTTNVLFGATPATFVVNSDTSITAISPPGIGTVDVTVTTPGGTSAITCANQFTYIGAILAPAITSINPNSGSTDGGTIVTITGVNFNGTTNVLFDAIPATFFVNSDTSITAISPAGTGIVDVRVVTAGGTSAITPSDQFTYIGISPVPSITSINPNSGPASGGTNVNIVGTGFTGATSVLFGAIPATFVVNSDTSITAISPAGIGTVDVRVFTAGGISTITASDQFTYIEFFPVPSIRSINPNSGSIFGGTSVNIIGTGFIGTSSVLFGTTPATFVVNSDNSITAISPVGIGTVDVRVVTVGGTSTVTAVDQFTYISSVPPQPPRAVRGEQKKNVFATQTELVNKISWKAPTVGSIPVAYHIYRDAALTELIAVIPANQNKLYFKEYGVKKHHNYSYFITTVDQAGIQSSSVLVVISS